MNKYYVMKNKNMAIAIAYILGRQFYTYDDRFEEGKKVFSFVDDEKFRLVLTLVSDSRKKYEDK